MIPPHEITSRLKKQKQILSTDKNIPSQSGSSIELQYSARAAKCNAELAVERTREANLKQRDSSAEQGFD